MDFQQQVVALATFNFILGFIVIGGGGMELYRKYLNRHPWPFGRGCFCFYWLRSAISLSSLSISLINCSRVIVVAVGEVETVLPPIEARVSGP